MRVWWKSTRGNENVPQNVNISRNQRILDINVSAALTGKTWSADDDPTGQNDRQLTLHTLMHFVGMSNLVLRPIIVFNNSGCT